MMKIDFKGTFDPVKIMKSGQCFRWKQVDENHIGVIASGKYIEMTMAKAQEPVTFSCNEEEWNGFWKAYFDADRDYVKIGNLIESSGDEHLMEAYGAGRGIRILKQDLFEIIISFMISQNNNITRISRSIELICERAGIKVRGGYKFPGPDEADPKMFEEPSLGLGYRAPYIKEMYEFVSENPNWLRELESFSFKDAYKELILRKGIGPKVANCICLFGLGHVNAFPIDTHVKQLLEKYYNKEEFDFKRYEGCLGIIQQFLFYYEIK